MSLRDSNSMDQSSTPIEQVQKHSLPESSAQLVDSDEDVVGDRNRFLWRWVHHLFPKFTLSCVGSDDVESLQDSKLTGLMFVSILDDIGEMHQGRTTFEEAAKIPFEHVEDVFVRQWDEGLTQARKFEGAFDTIDIGAYLDGIETVMEYQLASRGVK